ncbi:MAG: GGDEF domain-containing protein [Lachnospiraceae bacterium]|jgi:diguanylate cyclase (GGDEF)-like protein|nr:GGDEF domain-containing protein [Lachnospiraceae bacterium]
MKEERKRIVAQWLFPTLILVLVIVGLIANFSYRSQTEAVTAVTRDMTTVVERYAMQLYDNLQAMSGSARLAAEAIAQLEAGADWQNSPAARNILNAHNAISPAYMSVLVDASGVGINEAGEAVALAAVGSDFGALEGSSGSYVHVPDDRITGTNAIAYVAGVADSGLFVVSYYNTGNMQGYILRTDFDSNVLLILMDNEGNILANASNNTDRQSAFVQSPNLLAALRTGYGEEVRTMEGRMRNGASGSVKVALDGEGRSLVNVALPINQWQMIAGASKAYVDRQELREWSYARTTLMYIGIALGAFAIIMVVINMIAKLRGTAKTKQLMEKADTDLLTGLNNKVATERKVQEYMTNNPNDQALMFVLDIDNFKKINDTMGHAFGDEVLRSLGQQITPIFRASDIIGRIGGDEMIILLKSINTDDVLVKEATKVARFFHDFKAGEYVKYSATASIGCAIYPRDGKDFESMYKAADQALYMAKKRGKNQLAFYHDSFSAIVIQG